MKKTLSKRVLSGVTSAMIGFSSFAQAMTAENAGLLNVKAAGISTNDLLNSMKAADESFAPYSKEYSVENLLTDFNVVSFNDFYMNTHTVGAFLAGGKVSAANQDQSLKEGATFGDGSRENSYAGTLERIAAFANGNYMKGEYAGDAEDFKFYYGGLEETYDGDPTTIPAVQTDTPYFDVEKATSKIVSWSNSKRDDETAWIISDDDINAEGVLEIVVSDDTKKNIVIPTDIYDKLNGITFLGESDDGVVDINELSRLGLTITIKGQPKPLDSNAPANPYNPHLSFQNFVKYQTKGDNGKIVTTQLEKAFSKMDGSYNGELNLYGMNLVWNFPDATGELFVSTTSGHIVAPNAKAVVGGGEGGIIAKDVVITSELHYMSYSTNTTSDKAPGNNEDTTKPSTPPAEDVEKITIEARVIYGDYNDDDAHEYNNPELYAPQLQLMYRQGDEIGKKPEIDDYKVTAELVEDGTEARKDWCYQYKYTWEVPVLPDGDRTGYYVSLNPNNAGVSEFDRNDYNFYFLPEERFETGNIDNTAYNNSAQHVFSNDDAIVYIFLDPKEDWQNIDKETGEYSAPKTLNISMKKRWDGHNSKHYDLHPDEKIEVQLQRKRFIGESTEKWEWAEYSTANFTDADTQGYCNWYYYEDENGKFVDTTGMKTGTDIPEENRFKITVNGQLVDYVIPNGGNAGKFIDATTLTYGKESVPSQSRLRIALPIDECNNVILTLDGENNPQHFKNGYYYAWNSLPYGEYRVLETRSFIDKNDNDVFDVGIDEDTSKEYFYMVYPPGRDSSGVLHIQNYTKNVTLNVSKQWFTDISGEDEIPYEYLKGSDGLFDPVAEFEIYRSTLEGEPKLSSDGTYCINNAGDLEKINNPDDGTSIFKTNKDGSPLKIDSKDMITVDDTGAVYYYYLREIIGDTAIGINTNTP